MEPLLGILMRRRIAAQLRDLPPNILRDIGIEPTPRPRAPARGETA